MCIVSEALALRPPGSPHNTSGDRVSERRTVSLFRGLGVALPPLVLGFRVGTCAVDQPQWLLFMKAARIVCRSLDRRTRLSQGLLSRLVFC